MRQSASGQIIIEYILLLVIAVSLAALISKFLIGASKDDAGFVLQVWSQVNATIGSDKADDVQNKTK